jgi:hypothetical protein
MYSQEVRVALLVTQVLAVKVVQAVLQGTLVLKVMMVNQVTQVP